MNPHYNQNYTREEIDAILAKIKVCIESGRYIISQNEKRQENIDFINEYNIRSDKQKSILMKIETDDFRIRKPGMNMRFYMYSSHKYNYLMQMGKRKPLISIPSSI